MEILVDILKVILKIIITFLAIIGLGFFLFVPSGLPSEIEYYQNDIKIDAIKYHNEIYVKKGE